MRYFVLTIKKHEKRQKKPEKILEHHLEDEKILHSLFRYKTPLLNDGKYCLKSKCDSNCFLDWNGIINKREVDGGGYLNKGGGAYGIRC